MLKTIHLWTVAAAVLMALAGSDAAVAQPAGGGEYQIGDRVECDVTGSKTYWERGTIVPFRRVDVYNGRPSSSGYFFRVRFDSQDPDEEGRVCRAVDMRSLAPPPPPPPPPNADGVPMPVDGGGGAPPMPVDGGPPLPMDGVPPPAPDPIAPPPAPVADAAREFEVGDRVECDVTGSKTYWERGIIVPFRRGDMYNGRPANSGYFFRVRFDSQDPDEEGRVCRAADMRRLPGPPPPPAFAMQFASATTSFFDGQLTGTVMADRPIEKCPVEQPTVKPDAKPDHALIAKLIRCLWEVPARDGMDGAITIDLTPLKPGTPRRWERLLDMGNGNLKTIVHPFQTTYTWKTHYRRRITITESLGVFNCYVNTFGNWECGLSESKQLSTRTETRTGPKGS